MMSGMTRERWWAWMVPWFAGSILAALERPLQDRLGQSYSCLFYFVSGLALGWAWYRLHPRNLAARMFGLTAFVSLAIVSVTVFAGGHGEFSLLEQPSSNDLLPLGVLAGLVLTEARRPGGEWHHQKHTALSSRETMRQLR